MCDKKVLDKELALNVIQILSSLEALCISCNGKTLDMILPDYLHENLDKCIDDMRKIMLGE